MSTQKSCTPIKNVITHIIDAHLSIESLNISFLTITIGIKNEISVKKVHSKKEKTK